MKIDREQAIEAAARARHAALVEQEMVGTDDYDFGPAEYMRYQLREEVTPAVDAILALSDPFHKAAIAVVESFEFARIESKDNETWDELDRLRAALSESLDQKGKP